MFPPGCVPIARVSLSQCRIDVLRSLYTEVVICGVGLPMIDDTAFMQHEDGIVQFQVGEAMRDIDDDAIVYL